MALSSDVLNLLVEKLTNGQALDGQASDFASSLGPDNKLPIAADTFRQLLLTRCPTQTKLPPKATVRVQHLRFIGRLDLDGLAGEAGDAFPPLRFENCQFEQGLSLAQANLTGLRMDQCIFGHDQATQKTQPPMLCLNSSRLTANLSLAELVIAQDSKLRHLWLKADCIEVGGSVYLRDLALSCPRTTEKQRQLDVRHYGLEMRNADIKGDLISRCGLRVSGGITLRSTLIGGDIRLFSSHVVSRVDDALFAQGLKIDGNLIIRPNQLPDKSIDTQTKGKSRSVAAQSPMSYFEGGINLFGATICGTLDLSGTKIAASSERSKEARLNLQRAQVNSGVVASLIHGHRFETDGAIELAFANIQGGIRISRANIGSTKMQSIGGDNAQIGNGIHLSNCRLKKSVFLRNSHIQGSFELLNTLVGTDFIHPRLSEKGQGTLDLADSVLQGNLITQKGHYQQTQLLGSNVDSAGGGKVKLCGTKIAGKVELVFKKQIRGLGIKAEPVYFNLENLKCDKSLLLEATLCFPLSAEKAESVCLNARGLEVKKNLVVRLEAPESATLDLSRCNIGGDLDLKDLVFQQRKDSQAPSDHQALLDLQQTRIERDLRVDFKDFFEIARQKKSFHRNIDVDVTGTWRHSLSCYKGFQYVEMQIRWQNEIWYGAYLSPLDDDDNAVLLDGHSSCFHRLNEAGKLSLEDEAQALQYLRLFCAHVWGGTRGVDGAFVITDTPDCLPWLKASKAAQDDIEYVKARVAPPQSLNAHALQNLYLAIAEQVKQEVDEKDNQLDANINLSPQQLSALLPIAQELKLLQNIVPLGDGQTISEEQKLDELRVLCQASIKMMCEEKKLATRFFFRAYIRHVNLVFLAYFAVRNDGMVSMLSDLPLLEFNDAPSPLVISPLRRLDNNFTRKSYFLADGNLGESSEDPALTQRGEKLLRSAASKTPEYGFRDVVVDLQDTYVYRLADNNGASWGKDLKLIKLKNFRYLSFYTEQFNRLDGDITYRVKARLAWLRLQYPLMVSRGNLWLRQLEVKLTGGYASLLSDGRRIALSSFETQPHSQAIQVFKKEGVGRLVKPLINDKRRCAGWVASHASFNKTRIDWQHRRLLRMLANFAAGSVRRTITLIYGLLSSYGLSPFKVFLAIALLIMLGGQMTQLANDRGILIADTQPVATISQSNFDYGLLQPTPRQQKHFFSSNNLLCKDLIEPYLYATDTLIPLVDLNQEDRCVVRPIGTTCDDPLHCTDAASQPLLQNPKVWHWFRTLYSLLGWIMVSLFIFTLTSTLRAEDDHQQQD
ncbi:hypothetical protein [Bowmanella pacifica]|uniref:Membrane-associated oxidoreductase n=1 Tax=Bowmanella pacifica TaxID=502051 RepID=A0A917YYF9_9ALTE|nr:hypothetical protein [Bowmanella pacifica]GGO67815.1 hypothetical protein GCM10010982_15250 [Bowmanella pacifica]